MLTDGFMHIVHDLKQGRLQPDSITLSSDSSLTETFFADQLKALMAKPSLNDLFASLQPKNVDYWELKKGIPAFLDSMDHKVYTYVNYPYKKNDPKDSLVFFKTLQKRLSESGLMENNGILPDTTQMKSAISKYQKLKGLTVDGKLTAVLIRTLNISDAERYKRIAITLDRYKQLPDKMPEKYIWVNLPGFYLKVINHDTVALLSKIICGKPDTRTPLLNSQITDMVTYPTWTVPTSIIAKSYLPKLKNNPNYLTKLGLKLLNGKGEAVNAAEVNWGKYSKGIPFQVMQASGDNNALGVMKFNFNNPYAVYLHDTNQRYLFKNASRALSHGCVRVQEWEKLAFFIARNDSTLHHGTESLHYNTDSIINWIAHKERHRIEVKTSVPLFIRYFSCEGKNGKILFYSDIYGEDKALRDKYFAKK
jgi:murein L,D-transpeptidase YcbB/YkuD